VPQCYWTPACRKCRSFTSSCQVVNVFEYADMDSSSCYVFKSLFCNVTRRPFYVLSDVHSVFCLFVRISPLTLFLFFYSPHFTYIELTAQLYTAMWDIYNIIFIITIIILLLVIFKRFCHWNKDSRSSAVFQCRPSAFIGQSVLKANGITIIRSILTLTLTFSQ